MSPNLHRDRSAVSNDPCDCVLLAVHVGPPGPPVNYNVRIVNLNCKDFGVPQDRRRIFIQVSC